MEFETGFAAVQQSTSSDSDSAADRRADSDRRTFSDRRRAGGLFAIRARRDGGVFDRRQGQRRERGRSWLSRWRREG